MAVHRGADPTTGSAGGRFFGGATPAEPRRAAEAPGKLRTVTEARARELFSSVLHSEGVDSRDGEGSWLETILGTDSDFFAVTPGRQFVNLVP